MPGSDSKILFQALSEQTVLEMKLLLNVARNSYDWVEISVSGSTSASQKYPLTTPLKQDEAENQFVIEIDLANSPSALKDYGLLGLRPDSAKAKLATVRIVVRPSDRDDAHSSEHPYFALFLDWQIEAETSDETKFSNNNNSQNLTRKLTTYKPLLFPLFFLHSAISL